jgi:hypothetical protein
MLRAETVAAEFLDPWRFAPFNPHVLARYVQQIRTGERACTLRESQRGTQAHQVIAEAVARGASDQYIREVRRAQQARLSFGDRAFDNERCSALCDLVGEPHAQNDYIVIRTSLFSGMKRSVTGSNAEIKDVTLPSVQAALAVASYLLDVRTNPAMMPGQHTHDRLAVCLAGIQASSGMEREGECSMTGGLRKLD